MLSRSELSHADWHVLDLVYLSTGAFRIGGWLPLPREGRCGAASAPLSI